MTVLVVDSDCPMCATVQRWIDANHREIVTFKVGSDQLSIPVMIVPALVDDNKILAYGADIIPYLQHHR